MLPGLLLWRRGRDRLPLPLSWATRENLHLITKCGLAGLLRLLTSKSFIGQRQKQERQHWQQEEGKPKGCTGSRPPASLSSVTDSDVLLVCLFVFVCLFVCLEQEEVGFAWTVLCSPHPATPMAFGGTGYIFYLSEKVKKLMLKPNVKRFMKINVILSPS